MEELKDKSPQNWRPGVDYPEWAENNEVYIKTITGGYLLDNETPRDAYWRVANQIATRLDELGYEPEADTNYPDLATKFFDYIWRGWLNLATPVLSNVGTNRGLPISCFGVDVDDSIDDIGAKNRELMLLAKHGGGVGINVNRVRPAGSKISDNGTSDGVVPFIKIYDSTILATNQGTVRRGAASVNIDIDHDDFLDWLEIREPKGDVNRQALNMHQCAVINRNFMQRVQDGDQEARKRWAELIKKRKATGEPFIMFKDNVDDNQPEAYNNNDLQTVMTNICSEITLHTDPYHSFVCCLSSVNLARYDEWKHTDLIQTAIVFLDGVMEEFITKAQDIPGFENTLRFAQKSRAIGLGALGWHTYLQERGMPFESMLAYHKTNEIFKHIQTQAETASQTLAGQLGEPEWCQGTGYRHTHLTAIAPTVSNSKLAGNLSPGIEPWAANVFTEQTSKGTFIRKNPTLQKFLERMGKNTKSTWDQILQDGGSVQGLDLDDYYILPADQNPDQELGIYHTDELEDLTKDQTEALVEFKNVFRTFKEINQLQLVRQAGARQQYLDQSQSLNLAFPADAKPKFINTVHLEAHKLGIKTLYYMRTESVLRGDITSHATDENCEACDG